MYRGMKMKRFARWAAYILAAALVFTTLSCQTPGSDETEPAAPASSEKADPADASKESTDTPDDEPDPAAIPRESPVMKAALADTEGALLYRYAEKGDKDYAEADYTSFYAEYGRDITIADVKEDVDTGLAYVLIDGHPRYLGLDFLSRAMIYNTEPAGVYVTEEDVYAAWWRFYVTRWNDLLPEIPLYTEGAVLLQSSLLSGPEKESFGPSFDLAKALLRWQVPEKDSDLLLIGSAEKFGGQFRYPAFGKDLPSGPDKIVEALTNGLETVTITEDGRPLWNDSVVHSHEETDNEDGSRTYTITLWEDLRFSDGSPVTAKDYLAFPLAFLSEPGKEADPSYADEMSLVYDRFRLIDEQTFSVTISANALPDANVLSCLRFTAQYAEMWLGDAEILGQGDGCILSESFYERGADGHFLSAERLRETASDPSVLTGYPYSGPYRVLHYDPAGSDGTPVVQLQANDRFIGLPEGTQPIRTLVFKCVSGKNVLTQFENHTLEFYMDITGQEEAREAIAYASQSGGKVTAASYETGEAYVLSFRADLGPAQFLEVREALACLLSRETLAEAMTGGAGTTPDGPYTGGARYRTAVENGMRLDAYDGGASRATLLLEQGGWIYDSNGEPYVSGIRYKKIDASLMGYDDKAYAAADGSGQTYEKNGYYYMPLVLNLFTLKDTDLTDELTALVKSKDFSSAGMGIAVTEGSFAEAMDALYQTPLSGYYNGVPTMCAFTVFTVDYADRLTDDSFLWAVDPEEYERFSRDFFRDPADIVWLKD